MANALALDAEGNVFITGGTYPTFPFLNPVEGLQKQDARSGNSGSCWCGWRTVGSAPDENRFTMLRTGEMCVQWCRFRGQKGNSGQLVLVSGGTVALSSKGKIKAEIPVGKPGFNSQEWECALLCCRRSVYEGKAGSAIVAAGGVG